MLANEGRNKFEEDKKAYGFDSIDLSNKKDSLAEDSSIKRRYELGKRRVVRVV